jgi:hypothetical protein
MPVQEIKFDIKTEVLSNELVATCEKDKIECNNYYDLDGKIITEAKTQYKFDFPKKIELYRETVKYLFDYSPHQTFEFLKLYVDGKLLSVGEITEYRELKTKVKLTCCTGTG